MILPYLDQMPRIAGSAFVEETARVIGDVEIGADSSIWFYAVVRGDIHSIRIGERTNLQDHVIVHVTRDRYGCSLGDDVTVGHRAVIHGSRVGDRCLIGIGSTLMDGVEVGDECIIGAGALVPPRTVVPAGSVVMGQPGRVVRSIRPEELEHIRRSALNYRDYAANYRAA